MSNGGLECWFTFFHVSATITIFLNKTVKTEMKPVIAPWVSTQQSGKYNFSCFPK